MTDATAAAAADSSVSVSTPPPARTRAPRRSPAELTYQLDEVLVERLASDAPDWLAADRRAALERYRTVGIEPNQLYMTYLDLRLADLADVRAWEAPAVGVAPG
ncbi:MAG: hypothetical protein ACJ777_12820, partial [Chloroflexota bacterium]